MQGDRVVHLDVSKLQKKSVINSRVANPDSVKIKRKEGRRYRGGEKKSMKFTLHTLQLHLLLLKLKSYLMMTEHPS